MNNKIFKVFALGISATILTTGCQSNENKVDKIQKNEEIDYSIGDINNNSGKYFSDELQIDNLYYVRYFEFENKEELLKNYNESINSDKEKSIVVNEITNSDNIYEVILKYDKDDATIKDIYKYILFIKNDKGYIKISESLSSKDKSNIIKLGSKVKENISNSDMKKFVEERFGNLTPVLNVEKVSSATEQIFYVNQNSVSYANTEGKVETIKKEVIDMSDGNVKISIVARNSQNETIWTINMGVVQKGIDKKYNVIKGDKYFYMTSGGVLFNGVVEARNLQSGKVIWQSEEQIFNIINLEETKEKVFVFSESDNEYNFVILDKKNGKTLDKSKIDKIIYNNSNNYYINNLDSLKIVDSNLVVNVYKDEKSKDLVGYLKININDYTSKFETK